MKAKNKSDLGLYDYMSSTAISQRQARVEKLGFSIDTMQDYSVHRGETLVRVQVTTKEVLVVFHFDSAKPLPAFILADMFSTFGRKIRKELRKAKP